MAQTQWLSLDLGKTFLSVAEVGEILDTSEYVTLGMIDDGTLPAIKVGRAYRVAVADLEAFINAQRGATRDGSPAG